MLLSKVNRTLIIGTLIGLGLWSCGSDSNKEKLEAAKLSEGCSLNSDCNNPLVCTFERCHNACVNDRDCPLPQRCVRGDDGRVCQLADDTLCTRDSNCQGEQVCGVDGECRDECEEQEDCGEDQICANSGECASDDPDRDLVDDDGNIIPEGAGGGAGESGTGGSSAGGTSAGGSGGSGGTSGAGGTTSGGAGGTTSGGGTSAGGGTGGSGASGGCPEGFGDCDDDPSDCETPLNLITSCGDCETTCDAAHGDVRCDATTLECVLGENGCSSGFDDCDGDGATGCEAELAVDPDNCGECGSSCGGGPCTTSPCGPAIIMDPPGYQGYNYTNGYLIGSTVFSASNYSGWTLRSVTLPVGDTVSEGDIVQQYESGQTGIENNSVVFDNTYVYFAQVANPSSVLRKAHDGSGSTSEVFSAPYYPRFMDLSANAFYFMAQATGDNAPYAIYTVAKAGGTPSVLPGLGGRSASFYDLEISQDRVYWIEYVSSTYRVFAAPLSGGTPVELDADVGSSYAQLTVDSTHVYWNTYFASGKIRRAAHDSDTAEDVAVGVTYPHEGMALDDDYLYFWNSSSGYRVYRVAKAGGDPQLITTFNAVPYFFNAFAVDDDYVYGVGYYGELIRVAKTP